MQQLQQTKSIKCITAVLVLVVLIFMLPGVSAAAIESTTYTYSISIDNTYIRIQDAYMPGGIFLSDIGISGPEDMQYRDGIMYIADTGNGRIVR